MKMALLLKSPSGIEITINVEANTVTCGKLGLKDALIEDFPRVVYQGKLHTGIVAGDAKLLLDLAGSHALIDAISAHKRRVSQEKIEAAIPGLAQLESAIIEQEKAEEESAKAIRRGFGRANRSQSPSVAELSAKYPRAALYLKADAYQGASNSEKSAAGRKAKEILESGGDEQEAREILNSWLDNCNLG